MLIVDWSLVMKSSSKSTGIRAYFALLMKEENYNQVKLMFTLALQLMLRYIVMTVFLHE